MLGKELERHQPVIGFFGELEHGISDFFSPYLVYDRFHRGSRAGLIRRLKQKSSRRMQFWPLKFKERPLQSAGRAS
jgi:hypothetical protein